MDDPTTSRGAGAWRAQYGPILLIMAAALILMIPARMAAPLDGDSFWIDIVWADQFSAQLREGTLYPRWMPHAHGGLGAPVFYFYPPLAFYVTGLFSLLGVSTYGSVIAAFAAALVASGIAMYYWLKGWTRHPLFGALLYMAAPYHLVDFYTRAALAEFCAYALVPLVALGIRRAARNGRFGWLALSYAALIMTHLPAALLTTIFFVLPYCLYLSLREIRSFGPLLLGGISGVGLAAIYVVPMLALQQHVAIDTMMIRPNFQAVNWSLLTPNLWPAMAGVQLMILLTGSLVFAAIILVTKRRDPWAWAVIIYAIIILGLIPGLWSVPLLAKVQFPWRMLMLAEFVAVTALARARLNPVLMALAIIPLLTLSTMMLPTKPSGKVGVLDKVSAIYPDVVEYLPKGTPYIDEEYSPWALDLARRHPRDVAVGGDVIAADFYFPAWQVSCNGRRVATRPDPATKLLRWTGENCEARIGWMSFEWIGAGISLLFAGLLGWLRYRRASRAQPTGLRLSPQLDIATRNAPTAPSF